MRSREGSGLCGNGKRTRGTETNPTKKTPDSPGLHDSHGTSGRGAAAQFDRIARVHFLDFRIILSIESKLSDSYFLYMMLLYFVQFVYLFVYLQT